VKFLLAYLYVHYVIFLPMVMHMRVKLMHLICGTRTCRFVVYCWLFQVHESQRYIKAATAVASKL